MTTTEHSSGGRVVQQTLSPDVLAPLIEEAIGAGLQSTGIHISPALQRKFVAALAMYGERQADHIIHGTTQSIIHALQQDIQNDTAADLDQMSNAAAAEVLPGLTQAAPPAINNEVNPLRAQPTSSASNAATRATRPSSPTHQPVSSAFLAGMSEGEGEESTPTTDNETQKPHTGPLPPLDTSTAPDQQSQQAVKPGQENLPQWDLSPKQKGAYAQQQLSDQLQAESALGQGTTPDAAQAQPNPEAAASPATTIDELEQNLANQLQQVRGKNVREKNVVDKLRSRRHQRHGYHELLAQDKAARQSQSGGDAHQSISRRLAYAVGLKAVDNFAEHLGEHVKENIKTGQFKNFLIALLLSIARDLPKGVITIIAWAVGDPGIIAWIVGTILNLIISTLLAVVLFGEGTWFKRYLVKRFFGKMIIAFIAGFIPGFVFFPFYTVSIIIMKLQNDAAMRRQRKALVAIQEQIKELRKLERSGKNVSPRKIAKIKAKLEELKKVADE